MNEQYFDPHPSNSSCSLFLDSSWIVTSIKLLFIHSLIHFDRTHQFKILIDQTKYLFIYIIWNIPTLLFWGFIFHWNVVNCCQFLWIYQVRIFWSGSLFLGALENCLWVISKLDIWVFYPYRFVEGQYEGAGCVLILYFINWLNWIRETYISGKTFNYWFSSCIKFSQETSIEYYINSSHNCYIVFIYFHFSGVIWWSERLSSSSAH